MGCDIHMHVEYKIGKGKWTAHDKHVVEDGGFVRSVSATGRNYDLFGLLAGVRRNSYSDVEPKGLPKDVSAIILQASDLWDGSGHSHSYMLLEEFEDCINRYNATNEEYKIQPTDRTDMFYDYGIDYETRPPSFSTIISACNKQAEELKADYILLGEEEPDVKHRIVFWFDN